ncbi:MAG: site-specific integrase [Bryobacterales bacterium]|nr:site-specific integrase [Bryobacterales bacterium]
MLERCFVRPETLERIQCCWLGPAIARYGTWLCKCGYRVKTFAARVSILRQFGVFAQTQGAQAYEELPKHVEPFLQFWIQRPDPRRASEWLPQVTRHIRIAIEQMLRVVVPGFVGRPRRQAIREPFADRAPGFASYLRQERGLRDTTLGLYGEHLRAFAAWLIDAGHEDLQELSPAMVSDFLTERSQHLSRSTLRARCAVLRVFLRYLYRERLITRDLSLIVEAAPCYRLVHLPRSITVEDVRKLLDSIDRGTVLGRRDYAMLLLLVTYGLRAREVAALTLDDIEWRHDRLRIPARKADHSSAYPLSPLVGAAILEYLKAGRPETSLRQVFFHVTAPCAPVTQAAVSSRAAHYLHQSGIVGPRLGSHTFRHSCVQRLVDDAGWSLKAIGDYVGHASPASTEIYSKVQAGARLAPAHHRIGHPPAGSVSRRAARRNDRGHHAGCHRGIPGVSPPDSAAQLQPTARDRDTPVRVVNRARPRVSIAGAGQATAHNRLPPSVPV